LGRQDSGNAELHQPRHRAASQKVTVMTIEFIAGLVAFAFVTSITPGPNNLMLLASGVNFGFRRSLPHMFGVGFGFVFMIVALGLGVGQIFTAFPALYSVLKWVSIVYMLWLAWQIANAGPVAKDEQSGAEPMTFVAAALFQWVNPKAWAMGLTGVTAYTLPANYWLSLAIMALTFGLINIPSIACWAGFGVALRTFLQDPARVRVFNISMALLLIASLYPVLTGNH
jgi:threonine/homoserine/homoserine lactone efflux protein